MGDAPVSVRPHNPRMRYKARWTSGSIGKLVSLPSVVFTLAFVLLGWIASHSIAYALVDLVPHGRHDHHEWHVHGYLDVLKLAGGGGLVLAGPHGQFGDRSVAARERLHRG